MASTGNVDALVSELEARFNPATPHSEDVVLSYSLVSRKSLASKIERLKWKKLGVEIAIDDIAFLDLRSKGVVVKYCQLASSNTIRYMRIGQAPHEDQFLLNISFVSLYRNPTPEQYNAFYAEAQQLYQKVIKQLGIK